jgi:hypothetical protein
LSEQTLRRKNSRLFGHNKALLLFLLRSVYIISPVFLRNFIMRSVCMFSFGVRYVIGNCMMVKWEESGRSISTAWLELCDA